MLRQRSRPYLFSNTVAPAICAATIKVLEMLSASTELRDRLEENTHYFRQGMQAAGFEINPGSHPIVPVMLGDAALAQRMSQNYWNTVFMLLASFSRSCQKVKREFALKYQPPIQRMIWIRRLLHLPQLMPN